MNTAKPGDDVFTEADLEPSDDERRDKRRDRIDMATTILAVLALGLWMGGVVALGTCAAPLVFKLTPFPWSARAMGATFARFDSIAIACGVLSLGCEVVRTILHLRRRSGRAVLARLRRYAAIVLAIGAVYGGTILSPRIMALHDSGARRNVGPEGAELERLHEQAELIGKATVPLAAALIVLHIVTLRSRRDDSDVVDAPAPLPPGPAEQ